MLKNVPALSLLFVLALFWGSACQSLKPLAERPAPTTTSDPVSEDPPPSTSREEMELRMDIVDYAREFVGTKYKYAGKNPKGFDCSGFTFYIMDEFDISLAPTSRLQENQGRPVNFRKVRPGDLIFFRRSKNSDVFHVAIVVANDAEGIKVIHSTSSRGVVIDNLYTNSYWKEKFATARDVIDP